MTHPNRLHRQLFKLIAIETAMKALLVDLAKHSEDHREVFSLLQEIGTTAAIQRDALQTRFAEIGGVASDAPVDLAVQPDPNDPYPVTSALSLAAAAVHRLIIGYAMLRSIALRYRDSSLIGEGNTGDLAEEHTKNYVGAAQRINQILHNAVVWELDRHGETCQCTCPSCGLGICMCAQGPRRTLSDIWAEAGPISDEVSVYVHPPRPGSAAEDAGISAGDQILEAGGADLETHFVLQEVVSRHATGEPIDLRVQRKNGDIEDVKLVLR